mmetsp:Transcript_17868/g.29358  ORF Transcript_17868/g.29358 Transcript_17868/m.29358 type:complete len:542 (-) Transcript_17868:371-1996(-)
MKFGKRLHQSVYRLQYADQFLDYKALKRRLKSIPDSSGSDSEQQPNNPFLFDAELNAQLEKINEFFFSKEEDFVIRLRILEEECSRAKARSVTDVSALQQKLVDFFGELVALEEFAALNFTGLQKIVKKHSKKLGRSASSLNLCVLEQPFLMQSTLPQLIAGAHDCFATLDQLVQLANASVTSDDAHYSVEDLVDSARSVCCSRSRSMQSLRLLQFLMDRLSLSTVNALVEKFAAECISSVPSYAVLLRDEILSVEAWCIPRGCPVHLHDRPDTMSITRVLRGACQVLAYDWDNANSPDAEPSCCGSEDDCCRDTGKRTKVQASNMECNGNEECEPTTPCTNNTSGRTTVFAGTSSTNASSNSNGDCKEVQRKACRVVDVVLNDQHPSVISWPSNGGNLRWFACMPRLFLPQATNGTHGHCILLDVVLPEARCVHNQEFKCMLTRECRGLHLPDIRMADFYVAQSLPSSLSRAPLSQSPLPSPQSERKRRQTDPCDAGALPDSKNIVVQPCPLAPHPIHILELEPILTMDASEGSDDAEDS